MRCLARSPLGNQCLLEPCHEGRHDEGGNNYFDDYFPPIEEKVNHPKHYNGHPSGIECITIVEHLSFNVGNAIKYLWRAGLKDAHIQDLEKAKWYVEREIQRLKSSGTTEVK